MIVMIIIVSNLASAVIGWLLGRTGRNAAVAAAAVEEGGDNSKESNQRGGVMRPIQAAMAWVIIGIMAITAVNGWLVSTDQNELRQQQVEFSECVGRVVNQLSDALEARSASQREATAQLDQVMITVADAFQNPQPDSRQRVQDSISEYVRLRKSTVEKLAQHPLPEPPRNVCNK